MDAELKQEQLEDMKYEAKAEKYQEYKLTSDIDNLREHLEDVVYEANEILDTIGKELAHYGYDFRDKDILEFIRG